PWAPYDPAQDQLYEIRDTVTVAAAASAGVKAIAAHFAGAAPAADSVAATATTAAPKTDCDRLVDVVLKDGQIQATHSVAPPDTIDIGLKGVPPLPVQAAYCRVEATLHP